jgi:hypothetical protein
LAGSALIAVPAQADVTPNLHCTMAITTKHNGQHLLTVQGVITEWGYPGFYAPVDETNDVAEIIWYSGVPGAATWHHVNRRLKGLTVSVNLERAGFDPAVDTFWGVGIWTQPLHSQQDGCGWA